MLTVSTLLFLVLTNTVTSALEDNFSHKILASESYRHNHPPSFEPYDASDSTDFEVRKSRNVEVNENIKNEQLEEANGRSDAILESWSTKPYTEDVRVRSGNKPQGSNRNNKIKRRKQVRNQSPLDEASVTVKEAVSFIDEKRDSVTISSVSTPPTPRTIVPKTFTKRPPQDNPVTKRIREQKPVVKILEETNYVFAHNGNFHYSFEGADGTKVSSVGELKSFNDDRTGEAVAGEVHYTDNEGNDFSLSYTADENGYRPYGAHLPTPPPIPPAIARALKYLATKSTPEPVTEASYYSY